MASDSSAHSEPTPHGLDGQRGQLSWLVSIMRRLLAPDGCPWDREQTLETLKPYLIEECHEVIDAIDEGDRAAHCEELGDLLLQIVFQSQLAEIGMDDVIAGIGDKLIRRHPHVFGDVRADDSDAVLRNWEAIKAAEKGQRRRSAVAGVPRSLPALQRSFELARRAERSGFRWPTEREARDKVSEELGELDDAARAQDPDRIEQELGDALFSIVSWSRQLGMQPETALRRAATRFEARFAEMERSLADAGRSIDSCGPEELQRAWRRAAASSRS